MMRDMSLEWNSTMSTKNTGRACRLLVVDHDAGQWAKVAAGLAATGIVCVEAADAGAAWAQLSSQRFDIAVISLDMPGLDGVSLIQYLRNQPRSHHMPLIVIAAEGDEASVDAALQAGGSMFIARPVSVASFARHVCTLTRMEAAARESRTATNRAVATHRAVEAVLGNLAGEAAIGTAWLDGEIAALRRLPLPPDTEAVMLHRVNRIARECRALQDHAAKAGEAVAALTEKIVADDRKDCLGTMVAHALDTVAVAAAASAVRITRTLPPGKTQISCDGEGVQHALAQLLANAVAHAGTAGEVCLNAKIYPDGLLGIEITDHGPGMHPDVLARTFAPLQSRLDGSRAGPYMGFGLLFAKAIAEAHGGMLELRSMPDQGTTVLMTLPPERVSNQC